MKNSLLFFIVLVIISFIGFHILYDDFYIDNDTTQYLSVAKNFQKGKGFYTNIIYYDSQYEFGTMPIPQTIFPNGFPFFIRVLSLFGFSLTYSAFLLPLVCFSLSAIVLYLIIRSLGHNENYSLLITGIWCIFVCNWFLILTALSDLCYIFFLLAPIGCIIQYEKTNSIFYLFLASVAASLTFFLRYAGIVFIFSLFLYFFIVFVKNKNKKSFYNLIFFAIIPSVTIAISLFRNYLLTGTLRGGTLDYEGGSVFDLLYKLYLSFSYYSGFSKEGILNGHVAEVLLIIFIFTTILYLVLKWYTLTIDKSELFNILGKSGFMIAIIFLCAKFLFHLNYYLSGGVFAFRYLAPLIPICLILLAGVSKSVVINKPTVKKYWKILGVFALVVFISGQINAFIVNIETVEKSKFKYVMIKEALQSRIEDKSLYDYLDENISSENSLIADFPQELSIYLDKNIVGLAPMKYCNCIWTTKEVEKIARQFKAAFVIYFRNPHIRDLKKDENQEFFKAVREGNIPEWLDVLINNDKVLLLKAKS